ncbi:hypothetical protein GGF37_006657 [Kickxella alabastrina]|nr:hypothetical protein GGF37_006657 [Kickxella alabastrina]
MRWNLPPFRLPASLLISYIPDWALTLVSTVVWIYLGVTEPHYKQFSVDDKTISYPYIPPNEQTVTVPALFFISIGAPVLVIGLVALVIRRSMHDLHVGLLGLLMSVSLTLMFTNGLKNVVGRPRPNLLARCLPTRPTHPLHDPPQGLSTIGLCTQTNMAVLNEGFRSFPSGHTSLSFAGMTYVMFFLAGKLHVFDTKGHAYKSFVVFAPLLVAAIVGATRVSDYWHHPTDVIAGALIGFWTAVFSYHQYYPVLFSHRSDMPFDPRGPPVSVLPLHVERERQEERNIALSPRSSSPGMVDELSTARANSAAPLLVDN